MDSLQKEKTSAALTSPNSPPRNLPPSPQKKLEHLTRATIDHVYVRKTSSSGSQQSDKDASATLTASSQITVVPKTEIQKTSSVRASEKLQVPMTSRPSSAPLVPGPRPTAPVVSMVQTAPPLSRSVSAAGRLGPDPSPASHSYVPQSYRNAIMGNSVASAAASLPHSNTSTSGVSSSPGFSQSPALVSPSIFLPQGSDRMDSNSDHSSVPFGMITQDVLQNGPQWVECSQTDGTRSMHYDPPSPLNDVQNLDLYKPVHSRSLGNIPAEFPACTTGRHAQGLLADEFPHLDIINDLLDDEHNIGNVAEASSASFHPLSNGPQLLNRQFTFPPDLGSCDDLGSSTSSCRFERSRSYHQDHGFQRGYSSSSSRHFDSLRDYIPQGSTLPYVNGQVDGLVPNQWQLAGSDLSFLGMRNTENDGYPYYPDYSNMACGVNGYTVFRPSNGP